MDGNQVSEEQTWTEVNSTSSWDVAQLRTQKKVGGGGVGGAASTPPNQNLKNTDFVNMISEVLHYLLSSRNKLLKSGDKKYSTLEFWKMT
jgi:hypothetical protein